MAPWVVTAWPRHRQRVVRVLLIIGLVVGFQDDGTGVGDKNDAMSGRWSGGWVVLRGN